MKLSDIRAGAAVKCHMVQRDPALGGGFENKIEPDVIEAGFVELDAGEVELDLLCAIFIGKSCDDMIGIGAVNEIEARIGDDGAIAVEADIKRDDVMSRQARKCLVRKVRREAEVGAFEVSNLDGFGRQATGSM